jgi:hypothetical protein
MLTSLVIMARLTVAAVLLLVSACDGTQNQPPMTPAPPPPAPAPAPPSEWKAEIRLDGLLPAGAVLVGVAVDPLGRRYVLDRRSGLYELTGQTAKLEVASTDLAALAGLGLDFELTDVAAYGRDFFVFTVENEGLVFDRRSRVITSRFCYFPTPSGSPPPVDAPLPTVSQTLRMAGIDVKERTESVAFNRDNGLLLAQPRTIRMDTGAVAGAELFLFQPPGEQPVAHATFSDPGFLAGGMVALGARVLLGSGDKIFQRAEYQVDPFTVVRDFAAPVEITGMARDLDGDLLVLDGAGRRLLKIASP